MDGKWNVFLLFATTSENGNYEIDASSTMYVRTVHKWLTKAMADIIVSSLFINCDAILLIHMRWLILHSTHRLPPLPIALKTKAEKRRQLSRRWQAMRKWTQWTNWTYVPLQDIEACMMHIHNMHRYILQLQTDRAAVCCYGRHDRDDCRFS